MSAATIRRIAANLAFANFAFGKTRFFAGNERIAMVGFTQGYEKERGNLLLNKLTSQSRVLEILGDGHDIGV